MDVLSRVSYVRGTSGMSGAGGATDMGGPNVYGSVGGGAYGQSVGAQGSVQATGILILVLLAVLVLAHKKLPLGGG